MNYQTLAVSIPFPSGNHDYRLVVKESESSGNLTIWVQRNFNRKGSWDGVPSGWMLENVKNSPSLCIDFGQSWYVNPTPEAWKSISQYIQPC